jgi:peptidoglycan-associated lipoprotein
MKKLLIISLSSLVLSACATKTFVNEQVSTEGKRLESSIANVDANLAKVNATVTANDRRYEERIASVQSGLGANSKLAQDALSRANSAHKLAEGKLVSETVLSNDKFRFSYGTAQLSKSAEGMLADLVGKLKADNKNVFIEIQGHTDTVGSAQYNVKLGQERSEAVRQYLYKSGIPLHRINTVSYGESQPLVKGNNRTASAQNRRVVLMVLA